MRITRKDVDGMFGRFVRAAQSAGIDTTGWALAHGSKVNGNSYGVYRLDLPSYGHHTVYGFSHLGMTAGDCYARLLSAAYAFEMVAETRREDES